jgi:isopentenyl-diphosphate delta-isomerase
MEKIVLVDENDNEIGLKEKDDCHKNQGILHRAITVLIFNNENRVLITKRSKDKMLWPEIWEASCSTHPRQNENYAQAGERRVSEELGIKSELKFLSKFRYSTIFKDIGSENEVCGLLIGRWNKKIKANFKEVSDYQWISIDELKEQIEKNPDNYAPWLKFALENI